LFHKLSHGAKIENQMGKVVAVSKKLEDKGEVKCGDTVLFGKYAGTELDVEGTKYLIMRQSDVLAVLG
jgi:chaperonin GroES